MWINDYDYDSSILFYVCEAPDPNLTHASQLWNVLLIVSKLLIHSVT